VKGVLDVVVKFPVGPANKPPVAVEEDVDEAWSVEVTEEDEGSMEIEEDLSCRICSTGRAIREGVEEGLRVARVVDAMYGHCAPSAQVGVGETLT
jgi:hypothetical protein